MPEPAMDYRSRIDETSHCSTAGYRQIIHRDSKWRAVFAVISLCVALRNFGLAVNRNVLCRVLPAAQIFARGGGAAGLFQY
jgi:hypothetical protein